MWFNRRKKRSIEAVTPRELCFHSWKLLDVSVVWTDNGVESDYHEIIKLGCIKCNNTRKVDELEYSTMAKHKLIAE